MPVNPDPNIVYYDMNDVNTIKLAGGSQGSGILLVKGNLEINGGFKWYGIVVATGSIIFAGGGEKNITGGVMAGENAEVNVDIVGNISILYCSKVQDYLKKKVGLTKKMAWREIF